MIGKQIALWFLVNTILPIIVPALFLAIIPWLRDGSFPFIPISVQLIKEGFYIFSALTLVFSLYEDYRILKMCVGPLLQTFIVLMAIATLIMFYIMRQGSSEEYMSHNLPQFCVIWAVTAILAIIVKFRGLKLKHKTAL